MCFMHWHSDPGVHPLAVTAMRLMVFHSIMLSLDSRRS